MSIAQFALSEAAVGDQSDEAVKGQKPPPKRTIIATSDAVSQPEPR